MLNRNKHLNKNLNKWAKASACRKFERIVNKEEKAPKYFSVTAGGNNYYKNHYEKLKNITKVQTKRIKLHKSPQTTVIPKKQRSQKTPPLQVFQRKPDSDYEDTYQ